MIIWSESGIEKYADDDHRKDAPHFSTFPVKFSPDDSNKCFQGEMSENKWQALSIQGSDDLFVRKVPQRWWIWLKMHLSYFHLHKTQKLQ